MWLESYFFYLNTDPTSIFKQVALLFSRILADQIETSSNESYCHFSNFRGYVFRNGDIDSAASVPTPAT